MKIVKVILLVILILLSISTGLVKIFGMEDEMKLFRGAGFSDALTLVFGIIQTLGGLMLILPNTRRAGAITMAVTFAIATVVVFINGMVVFGLFSLLFIALAVYQFLWGSKT